MGAPETDSNPFATRRQFARKLVSLPAQVVLPGPRTFDVRLTDVGEGGLGIVASANPAPGTAFTIRFQLPGKTADSPVPIEGSVRVANSVLSREKGGFKIGLQFVDLAEPHRLALRQYVAY